MTKRERELHRKHRKRNKRSRQEARKQKLIGLLVLCFFVSLFCSHAALASGQTAHIVVKPNQVKILQDEQVPALQAKAYLDSQKHGKVVLDEKSGYTVDDLVTDINSGKYQTVSSEADGKTEGKYPIVLELDSSLEEKMLNDWAGKVEIVAQDSTLTVKNKVGTWSGEQFKRYDGTLVTNDFVSSKGDTYYFDADGNFVKGFQELDGSRYYFDKNGVMRKGWLKTDDGKYYFNDDGKMLTSWLTLDGEKYCFGDDGKMLTGEQQVGLKKCVFAKDGKLESEESSIDLSKPMMALTFDDGPGDRTMEILDVLEQYDAHATFFMVGTNAAKYQDEIRKMTEIGCELANHSYDHTDLASLSAEGVQSQISKTNEIIKEADGTHTATVMRPPFGSINDTVKANVGLPMILWSIDTYDWKTMNTQSTVDCILNTAGDGDIVLMHDIHSTSVDAAIAVIPQLIEKGYQLVTVSELAEAKGYQLENGGCYTEFYSQDADTDGESQE